MPQLSRSVFARYGYMTLVVITAVLLTMLLQPLLGPEAPLLLFWPTVMFAAWYGGLGPGLLATLLSGLAATFFFVEPRHSLLVHSKAELAELMVFLLSGTLISLLTEKLHQARRKTETYAREVVQQRERFRTTLASIGDAVVATDVQGRVTFMNVMAQRLTGWTEAEARERPAEQVFRIVHERTRQAAANPVRQVLQTGNSIGLANHTVLLRKDGSELPIDDAAAPICAGQDQMSGVVLVFRDVTEKKRLEKRLQQRVRDLAEADRSKNEFLATLAHELRNPLAPIRHALEILELTGGKGPELQQLRAMLIRQVQQLTHLVDDLLDVSRITRGKVHLQKQTIDLAAVVQNAVETSQPLLDARKHALTVELPAEPVQLDADPVRLAQILGNLLNNAVKYTDEGGHIWLTIERRGEEVLLCVRDNGMGIVSEMLPRIFDLFTQADRSLDRSQGGLGIGLTLVKRLVEMHGGSISAHSEGPGKGAEFRVRLPVLPRPEGAPVEPQERACQCSPRRRQRVLVVDDNADVADSLALLLELWGHDVRVERDGAAVLSTAATFRPEAMLLDIGLPGMNGYDLARQLRAQPEFRDTLLVALTGYGQPEVRQRSLEAGFDHHLTKPVNPEELRQLLGEPAAMEA